MAEWSRVLGTTLKNYIREVEVNVLRQRKLPALLKEKGRFSFGWSGNSMEWRVQYRRVPMSGYADMDTLSFGRQDRWKIATLDWRGYAATDAVSEKEKLMNKGKEAIINLYADTTKMLMDDVAESWAEEFYRDGTTAANAKFQHGIESFMGTSGASSDNLTYLPSQTFAGLSTVLGNYGGTWTGTWPAGRGDASQSYDFWTPVVIKTTGSGWGSGPTWTAYADAQLRYGIIKSKRQKSRKGMLDLILTTDDNYRLFLALLATKERIVVERSKEQSPLIALGFNDTVNFDGVDVTWEYGIPSGVDAYGFNTEMMEVRSLQDQVFVPRGPNYDEATMTYRYSVANFGNCTWNPRSFVKWLP